MHYYLEVLKKYAQFSGRACRAEYWMFFLFSLLIAVVLSVIDALTGLTWNHGQNGVLSSLYALIVLIPGFAVSVRRLHDIDRSGWWLLIAFIPIVGALVVLMFYCQRGTRGENRFGADPLYRRY